MLRNALAFTPRGALLSIIRAECPRGRLCRYLKPARYRSTVLDIPREIFPDRSSAIIEKSLAYFPRRILVLMLSGATPEPRLGDEGKNHEEECS